MPRAPVLICARRHRLSLRTHGAHKLDTPDFNENAGADGLSPKWQERFRFFRTYGALSSPEALVAFRALPYHTKQLINMNWFGFWFGPLYFFALGMWRRGLTLLGIALGFGALETVFEIMTGIEVPRALDFGFTAGFACLSAMTVNYSWYLKRVHADNGWNPFKGLRRR